MATISLQTKLQTVLQAAQTAKRFCSDVSKATESGSVSANSIVELAQTLQGIVINSVIPNQKDNNLMSYAAEQFADPNFGLEARIEGGIKLANMVIEACKGCVPVNENGVILKDTWNSDGSVSVLAITTTETTNLRTVLDMLVAAIPD